MVEYDSADIYIDSRTTINAKIAAIDEIISALETTAAKAASNDNIEEYNLDDGQVKIKTIYRGASSVFKAINDFIRLREYYINKRNGRVFRLVDSKNFIRYRNSR